MKNTLDVKKNKIKNTYSDWIIYISITIFAILVIYPVYYVIIGSFTDGIAFSYGGVWLYPKRFTFMNYYVVFNDTRFYKALLLTVGRTITGTAISVLFTALVAYAMYNPILRCKKFFYYINIFTMFFGGGTIPYFITIVNYGLYDTFWVYIIPAMYSVYNMIIISNFYKSIPLELREAAIMDGASELTIWWKVYMPLSKPILATICLWVSVGHWNGYMSTMLYTSSDSLRSLQYYLMLVIKEANLPPSEINVSMEILKQISPTTVSFAAIIIATLPIIALYPVIQKNFGGNVTQGSIKG